jgi:uncharacterized LabA/DUF88 family protein
MSIKHPDQRVGVFIDTQNLYYSARFLFGRKVNFKAIVEDAAAGRKLIRAIAYVIGTKTQEEKPFFEALQAAGIELREKELIEYMSGQKKGDWDVGLTVDAIRMLDMLDVVVLISGDGDYEPLVDFARSRGRIVEVMSFRETTSTRLVDAADEYKNLSEEKKRYLLGGPRRSSKPAQEEDRKRLERMSEDPKGIQETPQDVEERRRRRMSF